MARSILEWAAAAGFIGALGAIIGGAFGGARAGGGPVFPGKAFLVGEEGPELFMPRRAGSIVSNQAMRSMRGGMVLNFSLVTNIDARGATMESMTKLPEALKRNNERLKGEIRELITAGEFGLKA